MIYCKLFRADIGHRGVLVLGAAYAALSTNSGCPYAAEGGGAVSLLQFIRGCNRSQPHVDLLKHAVAILAHLSRYPQLHSSLLASSDCVHILAEQLQMFRDKEV